MQLGEFGYDFSSHGFGDQNSPLILKPKWGGAVPKQNNVSIESREGCDLNPLSVENSDDREKLIAYLWPDQPERVMRVEAAIEIARRDPPSLTKADAAQWVEEMFGRDAKPGYVRVLMHTIAWNYFPQETKNRIETAMALAASKASKTSPIAWLSFEFEGDGNPVLRLREWPGDEDRILATADPHVHAVNWLDSIK